MAFNPDEFDFVSRAERVEFLDEVEVFDLAGGFTPVVFCPLGGPFGGNIYPELGVGVDFAGLAFRLFDGVDDGGGLHAVVGSTWRVAHGDDFGFAVL